MNYEEFIKLAVEHWKKACDLNLKVQTDDPSATMKISKAINHRTSKSSVYEAISFSGISKRDCFKMIDEAVLKGDILIAHGHYRLSEKNIVKMLESEAKSDLAINVEHLKKKFKLRKSRTKLSDSIYATPAEELRKIVEKIAKEPEGPDLMKRKLDNLKKLYIGFVMMHDCLKENGYLENFETIDVNDLGDPLIKYKDGTEKVIALPVLLEQYEKCYAEAEAKT